MQNGPKNTMKKEAKKDGATTLVLIVEDDCHLSAALAEILRVDGYEVDTVDNGQDGFDYAASDIYDVVILDVMLPKMDGFQVVS